jgi:hypothetical protein
MGGICENFVENGESFILANQICFNHAGVDLWGFLRRRPRPAARRCFCPQKRKMSVQNIGGQCIGQKLSLNWEILGEAKALSVQVATSADFLTRTRTFVMPIATGVELDTGMGAWFFRVGAWLADGRVEWSGIYGPVVVMTIKTLVPVPKAVIKIIRTEAIKGGLRIYTAGASEYYAVIEYVTDSKRSVDVKPEFAASLTKTQYEFDWGRGFVDCLGLSPEYIYNIRITTFDRELGALPKDHIRQLCEPIILATKTPLRHMKPHDNYDRVMMRAGDEILRDVKQTPNYRFKTYQDYTQYLEAKARQLA